MKTSRNYAEMLRPPSIDPQRKRELVSQICADATDRFLAAGGKIYQAGPGETTDRPAAELNRAAVARQRRARG